MDRSIVHGLKAVLRLLLIWSHRLSLTRPLALIRLVWRWLSARPPGRKKGGDGDFYASQASGDITQIEGIVEVINASEEPATFPALHERRSRSPSPLSLDVPRANYQSLSPLSLETTSHPHAHLSPVSEGGEDPYNFRIETPSEHSIISSRFTRPRPDTPLSEHLSLSMSRPASPARVPRSFKDDRLSRLITPTDSRRRNRSQSSSRRQTPAASTTSLGRMLQHGSSSRASFARSKPNVATPARLGGRDPKRCQETFPMIATHRYDRPGKL